MRRIISVFLLLVMILCSGYRKPYKYTIDAEKDAFYHNNVGLNYLKDRIYYAAIQEFKIAFFLLIGLFFFIFFYICFSVLHK